MRIFFVFLFFVLNLNLFAARVDTLEMYSPKMQKVIKNLVVLPDSYAEGDDFPVVYLLHGANGSYKSWVENAENTQLLADQYDMMIVCPDGGLTSWYFDSPVDPTMQYESYIIYELIPFIDMRYKTSGIREMRAISGLSMGGHGALYIAMRHAEKFVAAGSMSGGVDFRPFPQQWDIAKRLGSYAENESAWDSRVVVNQEHLWDGGMPKIFFDCGTEDFFYQVNQNLHEKMLKYKVPHTFISRPGAHNWRYWDQALSYQLLFFHSCFITR